MKSNRIFSITLAVVMSGFLAVNSAHATTWTVTQLTDNSYDDGPPQVYGSNVVWEDENMQIFLYDGNSTTQLTNNTYGEDPQVSGSNVVWYGQKNGAAASDFYKHAPSLSNY